MMPAAFPPESAAALNDRALALVERGLTEEACAVWRQALTLDPEHFESSLNQALTSWRSGRATDGELVARFESWRAARNHAWPTLYALGLLHLERRDLAVAARLLEDVARRSGRTLDFESLLRRAKAEGGVEKLAELRIDRPTSFRLPIALSGDESVLLVGEGNDVILRRPQDLSEVARLSGHGHSVRALAVTPDGRLGVSGADDASIRVWDLQSRRATRRFEDPTLGSVLGVALSVDGQRAVTVSLEPAYVEATRQQAEAIEQWHQDDRGCILPTDLTEERVVHVWQLDSGESLVLERGAKAADEVRFSADGEHLIAAGGQYAHLRLFDLASGHVSPIERDGLIGSLTGSRRADESRRLPEHTPTDVRLAMTPDGRRAVWVEQALGTDDAYHDALVCYDTAAARRLCTIPVERGTDAVQLSADGTLAITATSGGNLLQAWRLPARWNPLVPLQRSPELPVPAVHAASSPTELEARAEEGLARRDFQGALEALSALREHPGHERTDASGTAWARLYRSCIRTALRSTWIVREIEATSDTLVRLAPDGSAIARSSEGDPKRVLPGGPTTFVLEDPRSGRPLLSLEGTVDRPGSLDFSANVQFLAVGGYATIAVWDLGTGQQQVHQVRHFDSIRGLRIGADGRHARFASRTGTKVWDGTDLPRPGTDPLSGALERDEHDMATTTDGRWRFEATEQPGAVHLVDGKLGTRRVLVPAGVISAEVSRDGQWLLTVERSPSASFRRTLRVRFLDWDLTLPDGDIDELPAPRTFPGVRAATPARERWIAYEDRDGPHRHRLEVGEWVIGRDTACDIVVNDFALSRRHAKLVVDEEAVRLVGLQSKGGTQVNAVPVVETLLAGGDHIRLGQFPVRFFDGSEDPAPEVQPTSSGPPAPAPEDTAAPEPSRAAPLDRLSLVRRIAAIKGRPPDSLDESSHLSELGGSVHAMMYVIATIESEYGVKLPPSELLRINTIGELVDLVGKAPKV
jgi:WD40 repeat protein/acyl carrier protein